MKNSATYAYHLLRNGKSDVAELNQQELRQFAGTILQECDPIVAEESIYESATFKKLPKMLSKFMLTDSATARDDIVQILMAGAEDVLENTMDEIISKVEADLQFEMQDERRIACAR